MRRRPATKADRRLPEHDAVAGQLHQAPGEEGRAELRAQPGGEAGDMGEPDEAVKRDIQAQADAGQGIG